MNASSFNLIDEIAVFQKRWKSIGIFIIISLAVTGIALLIVPKFYRSTTVVVPASPVLADKARLFNTNIQNLYSFFGNGDDVETLTGFAKSDTVYYTLIDEFKLIAYYETRRENESVKRKNTLKLLKKDIDIAKTEFNQLKIIVWTKDKTLSVKIANRIIDIIQQTEQNMWKQMYQTSLDKTNESITDLEKQYANISDSISVENKSFKKEMLETQRQSALEQIKQYQKSANELKLAIAATPPALYIVEKAIPSASADKPIIVNVLLIVLFASAVFGMIAALVYERKQSDR